MSAAHPFAGLGGIGDEAAAGLAEQLAVHRELRRELGWGLIELRTADGVALADLPTGARADLVAAVTAAELTVPCLDSRIGGWARSVGTPFDDDLGELAVLAGLARDLGTRYVRVMTYPNAGLAEPDWRLEVLRRLRVLTARAERLGVVLLIENCSGWAGTSAERVAEVLAAVSSPHLRLLFDIGNPVAHGYDGPAYLAELAEWVDHVHVKDALPPAGGGEATFTAPGRGTAELVRCLRLLLAAGYRGALCVEPHVAVQPHRGARAEPAVVRESYVEYCRALAGMLAEADLVPASAGGGR